MASFLYCVFFFFSFRLRFQQNVGPLILCWPLCTFLSTSSLYTSSKSLQQHFRWSSLFQIVPNSSILNISLYTALPKMLHTQFAFLLKHYVACSCETCHQATLLRALVRPAGFCVCILSGSGGVQGSAHGLLFQEAMTLLGVSYPPTQKSAAVFTTTYCCQVLWSVNSSESQNPWRMWWKPWTLTQIAICIKFEKLYKLPKALI